MKKMAILLLVILVAVPLFADTTTVGVKWKSGGTTADGYTDNFDFKVVFKGDEYFNIGFSQSQAVLTTSNGLQTLPFENNTLTLTRDYEDAHVAEGGTISFSGNCYIYWYVSYISQFTLKLKAEAASGSTINAGIYTSSSASSAEASTSSESGSSPASLSNLGESGRVGYIYGSRYIKLSVGVASYPADGKVGTLTLTLET